MRPEPYAGVIIEESLSDAAVLDRMRITKTTVEPVSGDHKTPWVTQWTMHEVEIPADEAGSIADAVSKALDREHSWYADFKRDSDHYIVFREKVFHVTDRSDKSQYGKAARYGLTLGIPEHQLDFSPHVKAWER